MTTKRNYSMAWRRSWVDENLEGSIRKDLTPAERSVWADLLDLCAKSRTWGVIERSAGIPYEFYELTAKFVTPLEIVTSCIEKCLAEGRLQHNGTGSLVVTNWDKYQWLSGRSQNHKGHEDVVMSPEDREAAQQAAAARLGYLQPEAAQRGIQHRVTERKAKGRK